MFYDRFRRRTGDLEIFGIVIDFSDFFNQLTSRIWLESTGQEIRKLEKKSMISLSWIDEERTGFSIIRSLVTESIVFSHIEIFYFLTKKK